MNPQDHPEPQANPPAIPNIPQAATKPPPEEPLPNHPDTRTLFEALLRRPNSLAAHLTGHPHGPTGRFTVLAVACLLLFGLVLGCFAKHEQLWAAPLKISAGLLLFGLVLGCFAKHEQLWAAPLKISMGLLIAGVICFPSLYIFSTLAGARVGIGQLAACLAGALALAGMLLLGFAPAVWIFAESTDSFGFMGALAIGSWLAAFAFAVRFLKSAAAATGGTQKAPLTIWSIVFLLVTLQMTTTLRPILGRSDRFLTQEKKFFLQHWGETAPESLPSTPGK